MTDYQAGLYSLAMIIWPEVSSQKMRQFISSLIGLVIAISGVLGPVLGGVLTRYASWRWIFWIKFVLASTENGSAANSLIHHSGPIGFVSMILFYLSWPTKDQLPNLKQRSVFDLDFVGSSLLIAAAVLVTFSFQFAGGLSNQDLWAGPVFIATITIGLVCWVGLFVWSAMVEKRWANRLLAAIPMALVRNRVYAAGVINTMFVGFPFFMTVYTFPLRTQVVNGKNPLQAGIALLPMLGAVAAGSALGPAISRKKNYMVETLIASGCLMVVGLSLETTLSASEALQAKALGFLVLIGLGFGLSASTSTLMTILESPIREHAPAQGILGQFRILGGSIGIAASTAILSLKSKKMLAGAVYPSNLSDLSTLKANASPELWEQIRQTYAAAFTKDMQVGAIVTAIGIIFAIAMWPKQRLLIDEMRQRQIDEETAWRRASNAPVLPMPTV
jgi:MFS family permease